MAMNWNTFFKRLGSAIIFSAIMLVGFLTNQLLYCIIISVIGVLCIEECAKLLTKILNDKILSLAKRVLQLYTVLLAFAPYLVKIGWFQTKAVESIVIVVPLLLLLYLSLNGRGGIKQSLQLALMVIYISIPLLCFSVLWNVHVYLPIITLLLIWMNDTMAYIVGSFIGRTPCSKISPKKTWEGTIGGVLLTIALAAIWGYFVGWFAYHHWIAIALIVAIFGVVGDLLESKIKREAGVKDSGQLMPGHGGALDRFDSLLIVAIPVYCYTMLFM